MLSRINLKISEKLRDKGYRHRFFRGRTQDDVASQLREFRKRRDMSQAVLARRCGMKQSAVSRLEQASYARWGIQTLWRIAHALDVRVRVVFDDMNDVIEEYRQIEAAEAAALENMLDDSVWAATEPSPNKIMIFVGQGDMDTQTTTTSRRPTGAVPTFRMNTSDFVERHRSTL